MDKLIEIFQEHRKTFKFIVFGISLMFGSYFLNKLAKAIVCQFQQRALIDDIQFIILAIAVFLVFLGIEWYFISNVINGEKFKPAIPLIISIGAFVSTVLYIASLVSKSGYIQIVVFEVLAAVLDSIFIYWIICRLGHIFIQEEGSRLTIAFGFLGVVLAMFQVL